MAKRLSSDPATRRSLIEACTANAGRPDELLGIRFSAALADQLRHAAACLPDIPVTVISAGHGFPRRFRAHWTALQADLAEAAHGRHIIAADSGHAVPQDQPVLVAQAILDVTEQVRRAGDV